ncbi:MAG: hypothetical protein ACRDNS_33650 [Trebonia sp.]
MRQRAGQRVGVGVGVLVVMLFDVEVAAVVIDDDVQIYPARAAGLVPLGALTGRPVTGHVKPREAFDVHVQQRVGLRPLIAPKRLAV